MGARRSARNSLSSPLLIVSPRRAIPCSSLGTLGASFRLTLVLTKSSGADPFTVVTPMATPRIPSSGIPPVPPTGPRTVLRVSTLLVKCSTRSRDPVGISSRRLLGVLCSLVFSSEVYLSDFVGTVSRLFGYVVVWVGGLGCLVIGLFE